MDARETLQLLLQLTRQLTEQPALADALQLVTDAALDLLPGQHTSIRVLDDSRSELLSGARSGVGAATTPLKHVAGRGVAGWVVAQGEVARVDDATSDERFVARPGQGFQIGSILAVPLWSAGVVIGVLGAVSNLPGSYSEEDEALASLLANCAVPPIERARLARLAVTDSQTRAYNHAFLFPGLREEMARHSELSVLMMDLDRFKQVNDNHGHAVGDAVLRAFAERVRQATRDNDVLVRRGGDEFVLIMPGTDGKDALFVAERLRREMDEQPIETAGGPLRQTVSIGAASWTGTETAEELEKRADGAMYEAKNDGRNRIVVATLPSPNTETTNQAKEELGSDRRS